MNTIRDSYAEQGYWIARGVFSPDEVRVLEQDFDRIVAQLQQGNEAINARWRGPEMERLGAATDAMGCVRVYPGSHKLGRLPLTSGQKHNEFPQQYPLDGATPLETKPGDVVFFNYFLLHGSKPNRSKEVRKTVLVQMHAGDDAVSAEAPGHPNERLVLRGWNHRATRARANAVKV